MNIGKGNGKFQALDYIKTGFLAEGDAKAIVEVPLSSGKNLILVSQNQDSLKLFIRKEVINNILLDVDDAWAEITFKDGSQRKQEFYYGNTYFSQSARVLHIPENIQSYIIYNYNGSVRKED